MVARRRLTRRRVAARGAALAARRRRVRARGDVVGGRIFRVESVLRSEVNGRGGEMNGRRFLLRFDTDRDF